MKSYGFLSYRIILFTVFGNSLVEGNYTTMDNELEKLYSPSQWSKRMGPKEVIQHHVTFVTEVSNRTRSNIPHILNVKYGPTEGQKLDIFGTNLSQDAPIFIYIHGGYWQMLSKEVSSYVVEPLYKNGYKVIVIGYDLCPAVTLQEIVDEIQRAFKYCIDYAKSNKSRHISIGGHSAGAYLTISVFTRIFSSLPKEDQEIIKGIYLISGIYDLVPLVDTTVNIALKLNKTSAKDLSVINSNINSLNKHLLVKIIVGEYDSPAFKEQAKIFGDKLKNDGWNVEIIIIPELDHFNIVENLNNEDYKIVQMIIKLN